MYIFISLLIYVCLRMSAVMWVPCMFPPTFLNFGSPAPRHAGWSCSLYIVPSPFFIICQRAAPLMQTERFHSYPHLAFPPSYPHTPHFYIYVL